MPADVLTNALIGAMAQSLSVTDLIRAAETLKRSGQAGSVENLYATWVQHNATHPLLSAVLFNYSVVLSDAGKLELAREALERTLKANPDFIPAYINLGRVYERLGNVGLAVLQWSAALAKLEPVNGTSVSHKVTALNQSARALEAANQDATAESLLRQSVELDNGQREAIQHLIALRQRQCKWPVIEPSERVTQATLLRGISPLSAAALTDDPLLQLAVAAHYNQADVGTPDAFFESWPAAEREGPLRIGYLSSDLREHAVGFLMTEVFALHDRKAVEVFAYYCGPETQDGLHAHFRSSADHFKSITGLDDAEAARQIAADGIQLLIDLNGYTREARLKVVARRPAPVIVNWLGYPGSMGSPYHHYLVADDHIIPSDHERYYSEKVVRLPCYQPSHRTRDVQPDPVTRAEFGLPEQAMVYCCFNGSHKINRFTFERWLMVLAQVPDSVLWLLGSTAETNERLRDYAEQRGIERKRLVFAEKVANRYHLARYPLADLFLDTTPYGAHTTASDALWMGVPVLTLSGRSFASRVCGSLVRAVGTPELVCSSAHEYVERAVAFGHDRSLLEPCREKLRQGRATSTLFDMPGLVRNLEQRLAEMWQAYRRGELPRPALANLDACLEVGIQVNHDDFELQSVADYDGFWLERLLRRHRFRPIDPDPRLRALGPTAWG
jgi:predicted O-linked N-acetylglucosamine transferase (SPINDLY family)